MSGSDPSLVRDVDRGSGGLLGAVVAVAADDDDGGGGVFDAMFVAWAGGRLHWAADRQRQ